MMIELLSCLLFLEKEENELTPTEIMNTFKELDLQNNYEIIYPGFTRCVIQNATEITNINFRNITI